MTHEFGQPAKRLFTNWLHQAETIRETGDHVQLQQLSNGRVYFANLAAKPTRFRWWLVAPVFLLLPALALLPKAKPQTVVKLKPVVKLCEPQPGQGYAQIANAWPQADASEITLGALKQVVVSGSYQGKMAKLKLVLRLSQGQWVVEKVTHLN